MKRSALLAGLMVLAAASSAAAQVHSQIARPVRSTPSVETAACPQDAYSIVQAPDGTSVSILFNDFQITAEGGGPAMQRTRCRIEAPLALPTGYGAGLTSIDYRGFALLGQRQSAEIAVDYEVGAGNRGPRFQRRLQGRYESDFAFTDRLPPGRVRQAGCGVAQTTATTLVIDATLTLNTAGQAGSAMVSLDSADQVSRALTYRFDVRPCPRGHARRLVNQ